MNENEFIERYGEEAFEEERLRRWEWYENYGKGDNMRAKKYREADPEKYKVRKREWTTKGGKFYEKYLLSNRTGQRGERNRVRTYGFIDVIKILEGEITVLTEDEIKNGY
jgi:hypothetical protein